MSNILTDEFTLTREQQHVFNDAENTDSNMFITGKPGVGKSVLINALRKNGQKHYTLGAPTGLAALNIGGKTLHSIFGIPISEGIFEPDFNKFTTNVNVINHIQHAVKHLIVDEISMVRVDVLEFVDRCLKYVKGNDLPFGGIQVILVGDFFQLPPIVRGKKEAEALKETWEHEFAFASPLFSTFKFYTLTEVLRQKGDLEFISILHAARIGRPVIKDVHIAALNKRVEPCTDFRIRLVGKNADADLVNTKKLKAIESPARVYHADKYGIWPAVPAEETLTLKVGTQVLIKKNNADKPPRVQLSGNYLSKGNVVNGTIGIIEELPEPKDGETLKVMVRLPDDTVVPIFRARWEQKIKERQADGKWGERVVASFEQMPLQLAWAISMHKSQGQSFEQVHVDPGSVFAAGQLYVAISRARTLAGLSLQSKVDKNKFWSNKHVVAFVKKVEAQAVNKLPV